MTHIFTRLSYTIRYKFLTLNIFLFLFFGSFSISAQTATQPSGSGTNTDPYLIENLNHLYWVASNNASTESFSSQKYFSQTEDIDATDTVNWTGGWLPIGGRDSNLNATENQSYSFAGKYNGNGYTISNLYIDSTNMLSALFGIIWGGSVVTDVHLANINISSTSGKTGSIAGLNKGTIYNCSTSGTLQSSTGGLGGITGQNQGLVIYTSANCSITSTNGSEVGGLIGTNQGSVSNCYATGNIAGQTYVGGLIGSHAKNITKCYANANVTGTSSGGLIGILRAKPVADDNYWNTTKSPSGLGINASGTFNATALTDDALKVSTNYAGWDFASETANGLFDYWYIGADGYPDVYDKGNFWTGSVNTNWFNAANWSGNIVPNSTNLKSSNIVTIRAGLTNYPVLIASVSVHKLTIEDGGNINYNGQTLTSEFYNEPVNQAPEITGTPATSVDQDATYSFTPTVTDPDGETNFTFSITNQPSWANFDTSTGALTGTPSNADVGNYVDILIEVTDDGGLSDSLALFDIEVVDINDAPEITGTPATSVDQDATYSFTPTVTDPDGETNFTFSITNQPSWASFDTSTGALTGTPSNADVGNYVDILIEVTDDGGLSDSLKEFDIIVNEVLNYGEATKNKLSIQQTFVDDRINVLGLKQKSVYSIYAITGAIVDSAVVFEKGIINTAHLQNGLYILTIGNEFVFKFIKK